MKKGVLLIIIAAGVSYVTLSSSASGGDNNSGADGTCATGTGNACNGCHGSSTSVAVTIELDSAGVPVTQYHPGMAYTIKVSGTNGTTSTLPYFGFQATVVKAAGAGTGSATNAGTLGTTGLPAKVRYTAANTWVSVSLLEQNSKITATTGSGASGTTYVMSGLPWTAPVAGTGTVMLYGCINAVNGSGSGGDKWNKATPVSISEYVIPTQVSAFNAGAEVKAFPNPASTQFRVDLGTATNSDVFAVVTDMTGRTLVSEVITAGNSAVDFDCNNWGNGLYHVTLTDGKNQKTLTVAKQ